MTAVDQFILYFPYILLVMALLMVFTERVFVRIFKSGLKLDMFYNLVVKDTLESEDQATANAQLASAGSCNDLVGDLENSKTAIEVSQTFQQDSWYMFSYITRTILELALAIGLLVWILLLGT